MKVSYYNIYFKHKDKNYVYNTLTTSLLSLDDKTVELLQNKQIDKISEETQGKLYEQNIIVDDTLDELAAYEYYYNTTQYCGFKDELRLVFVPTYNCNLRCVYCFEECHSHKIINQTDIIQIVAFVKEQLQANPLYKKLSVVLFGGEPLLCADQCATLCDMLSSLSRELGLEMSTKISTNAILITPEIIQELFIPNKMRIQITMDGNKGFHNQRRIYKNGMGTYDKIINSIKLLNEYGIKDTIDLRINVDKNNIEAIDEVLQDIHDKVGYIYVGLLRAVGNNLERVSDCISDNDYILYYRPILEPLFKRYGKNLRYGDFGKKHACALNSGNSFIVDCDLKVYKCDNLIGQMQYAVGEIMNGHFKTSPEYYSQRTWSPFHFEKCRNCILLPACTASCAYLCLLKNNSMNKPVCAVSKEQLIGRIKQYIDNSPDVRK